jgi:UPF0755 protein
MKRRIKYILCGFIIFDLLAAGAIFFFLWESQNYWKAPITNPINNTEILIEKGESFNEIVAKLASAKIIERPTLFKVFAYSNKHYNKYIAGYYRFEPYASPFEVSEKLANGEVATFSITFPEGLLSEQIVAQLKSEPHLAGEINEIPSEGSLLPNTYHFHHGDDRTKIIARMQQEMAKKLDKLWEKRQANMPYENKEDALIMASIIEKETGVAPERERIAAVFINRLRKGMRLQSDPTANYGIYKETGELKTHLTKQDVLHYSVYNTYVIDGLPATPICNVGLASLKAALNPAQTDELYFVANGEGGHNFARNLSEHNRNVANYRKKLKDNNDEIR